MKWLAFGALLLGGCLRIYPDPELPDIDAQWTAQECSPDTPTVRLTLRDLDTETSEERTFPCTDERTTFADVPRDRYFLHGELLDVAGTSLAASDQELDLRNGLDGDAYLYFGVSSSYARVAWTFANGDSCSSLNSDYIRIDFTDPANDTYVLAADCESGYFLGYPPPGMMTVQLRAFSASDLDTAVAISPAGGPFLLMPPTRIDLGTFVLASCGGPCP